MLGPEFKPLHLPHFNPVFWIAKYSWNGKIPRKSPKHLTLFIRFPTSWWYTLGKVKSSVLWDVLVNSHNISETQFWGKGSVFLSDSLNKPWAFIILVMQAASLKGVSLFLNLFFVFCGWLYHCFQSDSRLHSNGLMCWKYLAKVNLRE